jgi:hypothetical protein
MSETVLTVTPITATPTSMARQFMAVSPNSVPPNLCKKVTLFCSNVQLAAEGVVTVMLGQGAAIPVFVPMPDGFTGVIPIYDGESGSEQIALDEFSLSQPLTGGSMTLLCVF